MKLTDANRLDPAGFVDLLGGVFEHSAWVAERVASRRPFGSVAELHRAMREVVSIAARAEQLALIRAHPELAGVEAKDGSLTRDSSGEQGRLGFTALSKPELERISGINRRYREKFGFPCIVALRLHQERASVIGEMERRIANDPETELRIALEQIGHIARGRLARIFGESSWDD